MAWNPANKMIYLSGTNSLTILNPASGNAEATLPLDNQANRLVISPDGSYLYMANGGGTLLRRYQLLPGAPWLGTSLDLALSGLVDFVPVPGSPGSVAVYIDNGIQNEVAIYDGAVMRATTAQLPNPPTARALVFSADGKTLYYAVGYSSVSLSTMPVTGAGVGPVVTQGTPSTDATPALYFRLCAGIRVTCRNC
jgi:sugar lactone lactonase YvrE